MPQPWDHEMWSLVGALALLAAGKCLPNAIPEEQRLNITSDGRFDLDSTLEIIKNTA